MVLFSTGLSNFPGIYYFSIMDLSKMVSGDGFQVVKEVAKR